MKKSMMVLFLALSVSMLWAQETKDKEFRPTTHWPYVFADFELSRIYYSNGTYSDTRLNIHLKGNKLQCINGNGQVSVITMPNIARVNIAGRDFRYINDELMECLFTDSTDCIVCRITADFEAMLSNFTPYRMTGSTTGSMDTRRLNLKGITNESYTELRKTPYDGLEIPVKRTCHFLISGTLIPARLKGCRNYLAPERRQVFKTFVKRNVSDWHSLDDLKKVLTFLQSETMRQ